VSDRRLLSETTFGIATIDPASGRVETLEAGPPLERDDPVTVALPLVVACASHGSRVVAALARRPPLALSDDTGITWREAGGGLPALVAVAIAPDNPDLLAAASTTRLYLSDDGGLFWRSLPSELVGIVALRWTD
jgi:hypothetical protein